MSIVAYAPDDLTVTVTADTTLAALQEHLARRGQWLPVDPPHPERTTLGEIVDRNLSGPRRYGHGTIREHLLGIRAQLADGRTIKNGGAVVKNAAGYDLCRLFTGAGGELGTLLEATFKVQPRPELERFLEALFPTVEAAAEFVEKVDASVLLPVVLDLHRLTAASDWTVVVGFAGDRETVEWQCAETARFGAFAELKLGTDEAKDVTKPLEIPLTRPAGTLSPSDGERDGVRGLDLTPRSPLPQVGTTICRNLDYDTQFWNEAAGGDPPAQKLSVLPSKLVAAIQGLGTGVTSLLARAGNGVIYYRGGPAAPKPALPRKLMQQLKNEFDPQHRLPAFQA